MRKQLFAVLSFTACLVGCNQSLEISPEIQEAGVYATIQQPESPVSVKSLNWGDSKLAFTWAEGENVVVFGDGDAAMFRTVTAGAAESKLESKGFKLQDGVSYYACIPAYTMGFNASVSAVPVSFTGQRQLANNNSDHLKYYDYACASATKAEGTNALSFELKNQVSWIVLEHNFASAVENVVSFSISCADADCFAASGYLDVVNSTFTAQKMAGEIKLALGEEGGTGLSFQAGETFRGFITVAPVDLTGKTLAIKANLADGTVLDLGTIAAGGAIVANKPQVIMTSGTKAAVASVGGVEYATVQAAMAAVKDGETVTLTTDALTEKVSIDKSVTIDLNGKTLTNDTDDVFKVTKDGLTVIFQNGNIVSNKYGGLFFNQGLKNENITFNNCNVTGVEGAIATSTLTGSTITINGGTFVSSNNAVILTNGNSREGEPNTIIINGGTFKGQMSDEAYGRGSIACGIYAAWKDNIIVNDGTFDIERGVGVLCRGGKVSIKGGVFTTSDPDKKTGCVGDSKIVVPCQTVYVDKDAKYPDYKNAAIEISGGQFSDDACKSYLAENHTVKRNKTIYTVEANSISLNGTTYSSLQEAIDAAVDGQPLTFYNDVITNAFSIPKGKHIQFRMNGRTVTVKGSATGGGVVLNGDLTIAGTGSFGDATGESVGYLFNINDATLTIEEGCEATFQCGLSCIQMQSSSAKAIINGGKWIGGEYGGKYWTINKIDAYKDSQILISGGQFYKFNPSDVQIENPVENWVNDGYVAVQNGDWYEVVTLEEKNTREIEKTLSVNNATATISEDVKTNCISLSGRNTTIKLENGAVISGSGQGGKTGDVILTGKDLNLKGQGKIVSTVVSDEKKSQSTAINVTNGTVNIYDGIEVDGGNGCDGNYAVKIVKGTVNIHGGYFHSAPKKEGDVTEVIYLASAYAYSSKCYLNIYGGVFESGGDPKYLINCQDNYRSKCHIKIMGGIFVGFNPANNTAEGANTNWVPDGYVSTQTTYNGKTAWEVKKK